MLHHLGYQVSLVSTYPVFLKVEVKHLFILPVAFSAAGEAKNTDGNDKNSKNSRNWRKQLIQNVRPLAMQTRYLLGPSTLPKYQKKLLTIIQEVKPDLVHALRVPYEGMLARVVPQEIPLLVSIWGNDFTLHARANRRMGDLTKSVMERADGVLADVNRDIVLAHQWGLAKYKPTLVVPGGGGIIMDEIHAAKHKEPDELSLPVNSPLFINPRGIRAYARTDIFFQAIPWVIQQIPNAIFICPGMKAKPEADHWVEKLMIQDHVRLLSNLDQNTLWSLFHLSQISLSITTHDGTPNTLLEAMACGCFPIAGDIDSLREWITPGVNGFLVETNNAQKLADAIITAFQNPDLRKKAGLYNQELIKSRAEIGYVRILLDQYYKKFL
jgi:glycosyltransferase involved in cell wall biosynthesis